MSSLKQFLLQKKYSLIKLTTTATEHLQLTCTINNVSGDFILDTGASNSCVDFKYADYFKLLTEDSKVRAAGAGATNMLTRSSTKNSLNIGNWTYSKFNLVLFDMTHVNQALVEHESEVIHGIIGADILNAGKAIIDYKKKRLYLK
ncbi:retropepsin-like aspartic protease [Psychroflexus planctonicus]|nr:retropepsin-like aspartic protease [Psychroflexus planctonicus]